MSHTPLGAVLFDDGDIDGLLGEVADVLTAEGHVVRGALQSRGTASGSCHCADMDLVTIGSGQPFRISQPLGNGSRGCRLDPGALASCSSFLAQELADGADLLILNRFGRGESEGRGFRDLIASALALDIPVLTAVRPTYAPHWATFSAGLGCCLPAEREAVLNWAREQLGIRQAA